MFEINSSAFFFHPWACTCCFSCSVSLGLPSDTWLYCVGCDHVSFLCSYDHCLLYSSLLRMTDHWIASTLEETAHRISQWGVSFCRKVCLRTPIKVASLNFHVRQSSPLQEIIVLTVLIHYMKALLYKNDHCHLNFWSDFFSDTTWSRNRYELTKTGSRKMRCLTRLHKTRAYPDFRNSKRMLPRGESRQRTVRTFVKWLVFSSQM